MPINIPKKKVSFIIMDIFKESIHNVGKQSAEDLAEEIRQRLVDRIRSNDFDFKNKLKDSTLDRKTGEIPLIDTEEYVNSIKVWSDNGNWVVGVEDNLHKTPRSNTGGGIWMRDLAHILEFGSSNGHIPPRPHWRPVLTQVLKENELTKNKIAKKMQASARAKMREYNKERDRK